jgi:siroheme synthase (precorrin-2 oxidase/ferrochelatase)
MSFGYPVMLELAGRRCVVVGAQAIHEGKVEGLLAGGADDVLVVEPSLDDRFDGVEGVRTERRAWRPGVTGPRGARQCDGRRPAVRLGRAGRRQAG